LKEITRKGIVHLTYIGCNSIIRTGHFPAQQKVTQIMMIAKPGKPLDEVGSYRPMSLLPIMSKIFEKSCAKEITPNIRRKMYRTKPSVWISTTAFYNRTSAQNYRVHERNFRKKKQHCSAAFVDITQAFDKIWHPDLLFKIRKTLLRA
jgi:hypothetical protein